MANPDIWDESATITGPFIDFAPEPFEVMAQHNIWEGFHERALLGWVSLAAMHARVNELKEVEVMGDGLFIGSLIVSRTAHPTGDIRQMEVVRQTFPYIRPNLRGVYRKREVVYELPQSGSRGIYRAVGGKYSNMGKLLEEEWTDKRPLSRDDLSQINRLYTLINNRQQVA